MRSENLQAYLKETLVYDVAYQPLYKCFVERGYFPHTIFGGTYGGAQLYSDLNLGVWYMGAGGNVYKRIEFSGTASDRTEVRIYAVLDYAPEMQRLRACGPAAVPSPEVPSGGL